MRTDVRVYTLHNFVILFYNFIFLKSRAVQLALSLSSISAVV